MDMELLHDGLIAALAAIGLTTVIFLAVSIIFHPRRSGRMPAIAVIPAAGEAERLEHTVCALERSRYEEGGFVRIVILDRGMSENAKKVAQLLCRDDFDVYICTDTELENYLE